MVRPTLLIAVPRVFNKVYTGLNDKIQKEGGLAKRLFDMGLQATAQRRAAGGDAGVVNRLKLALVDRLVYSKVRAKVSAGGLKMALSSSAALSPDIADFFWDIGIPVCEAWGMTELSPAHTVKHHRQQQSRYSRTADSRLQRQNRKTARIRRRQGRGNHRLRPQRHGRVPQPARGHRRSAAAGRRPAHR